MSSAPVATFSGLSSGIDTAGIISQLQTVAQKPITNLQNTEGGYNDGLTAWQDFNSRLSSLQSATTALTQGSTFKTVSGTSSNVLAASFTANSGATIGDHSLTVNQLAQAQKVVSASQSSSSIALGLAGTFNLNGKSVTTKSSDTLADIAVKINAAGAGVSANVVNVGTGDFRLTLTGSATGAANAFSAADSGGGTVLASLGVVSGTPAIRQAITPNTGQAGAASLALGSATQTIATVLGLPASPPPASGSVTINGTAVSIDFNSDSLSTIANKINGAQITGVTAQVVAVPDANGTVNAGSKQQLQIVSSNKDANGTAVAPTFGDSSQILATVGIVQQGYTNIIATAKDAKFNLDGLNLTRSSNIVSDAVPSATIKLLSGTPTTPAASTLSVAQNTGNVVSSVANFVNAYNGIQDFVTLQNQFTPTSTAANGTAAGTNPLFGDSTVASIQNTLTQALSAVSGNTTLEDIGITYDTTGKLKLDTNVLTTALQNDPTKVANLFGQTGQTDNSAVTFVGATNKTVATAGTGYAVQLSQAATQASGTASVAQTSANTGAPETLTFGGTLFASPVSLTLTQGSTLQDTVNQINSSSQLNGKIYASVDSTSGKLTLSAQQYGAGNGFSVLSNLAASASNSGIGDGTSGSTTITDGTDVAGTINGEAAVGKGRTLTGAAGNAHTEGLSLLVGASPADLLAAPDYNAAAHTASFGHVSVTHGVADGLSTALTQILDPTQGAIIGAENSLNSQISDTQAQITRLQDQISAYTDYLRQTFSAMETRVSQLQAQGSAFAAQIGSTASTGVGSKK